MVQRVGPVTKDTSTVTLGLAKILVGNSADNITKIKQVLDQTADSLGALNSSTFTSNVDWWELESGYPLMTDLTLPLREVAQLECEFKEISSSNLAYARGLDGSVDKYSDTHSGEITLGTLSTPEYIRAEAIYTYPNKTNTMVVVFPRAQIQSSVSLDFAAEDNANVPITIKATRADSDVSGISTEVWDNMPLGRIFFT